MKMKLILQQEDGFMNAWDGPVYVEREQALRDIYEEFETAYSQYKHFQSPHEGWAVLREEVDELWDAIKENGTVDEMRAEAIQIAAVALRFILDIKPLPLEEKG